MHDRFLLPEAIIGHGVTIWFLLDDLRLPFDRPHLSNVLDEEVWVQGKRLWFLRTFFESAAA